MSKEVYVLRTCNKDMTSWGGFIWPKKGWVEAPDWDETPYCGNGLHGLLWGEGDASLLNNSPEKKWLVVRVVGGKTVCLSGKVKFKSGEAVYCGTREKAVEKICMLAKKAGKQIACVYGTAIAKEQYRYKRGFVGEGHLKPDIPYRLNSQGEFEEVKQS